MAVCGSKKSRTSRRPHPYPPLPLTAMEAAVAAAIFAVLVNASWGAQAAVFVKSNNTYSVSSGDRRIAEEYMELELLVEELYYSAHVSRLLTQKDPPTRTQETNNANVAPCSTGPGKPSDCSPPPDTKNTGNCGSLFNRNCKP